ncbi:MAG: RloB family protein [Prevotella sp.]|nr:RloB family protein [Prevotella sp.]
MGKKKKLSAINLERFKFKEVIHSDVKIRCRILIVCEGEKTEPNYFRTFDQMQYGSVVYKIDFEGGKINTVQVVEKAIELRDKAIVAGNPYDTVWAVFDKDDFPASAFNAAIIKAERHGIGCAWSNEAFELWYVFHFVNRVTAMGREEYKRAISKYVNESPKYTEKTKYSYQKNALNSHEIMTKYGDETLAISYAQRQEQSFNDTRYATHNPCTTVYKLVRLLRGEDSGFNEKIMKDLTTHLS